MTSASTPPTNYWSSGYTANMTITADYTTFSYADRLGGCDNPIVIDNCTINYADWMGFLVKLTTTVTSFTNNTFDNCTNGMTSYKDFVGTNLVFTNNTNDIRINNQCDGMELLSSNFDLDKIDYETNEGWLISHDHNDVSNDYYICIGSADTALKSDLTNDYTTGDAIVVYAGTFTVDEASACETLLIMTGAEWKVDAVGAGASLTHAFDDVSGAGFVETTDFLGTLTCLGSATYGVTITSAGSPSPSFYWNADRNAGAGVFAGARFP